jgi:type II secretion system protein G
MTNTKRGFTLIELLVVIAIIGILSSVVLASLNSARQKARDSKRLTDIAQIQTALELYFDSNGDYPTTTEGIAALAPAYIPTVPTPPKGTGDTAYGYAGAGVDDSSYCLGANLENDTHPSKKSQCTLTGQDHTVQP